MAKRAVVEIGLNATDGEVRAVLRFLRSRKIAHYMEPPTDPPYRDLAELEADCEGK